MATTWIQSVIGRLNAKLAGGRKSVRQSRPRRRLEIDCLEDRMLLATAVGFDLLSSSALESASPISLGVSLSQASNLKVTVNYAISGGTATGGGVDYGLAAGTLTFNPGVTALNIPITIVNDALDELGETIQVKLLKPSNAVLGAIASHTHTIVDDDPGRNVTFALAKSSGSESVSNAKLTVGLTSASTKTVTVDYAVSGGTATGGGVDYMLASGQLFFAPGETSKDISVQVAEDSLDEVNETVLVTLSNAVNAALGSTTVHTYTIQDNDPLPGVAFAVTSSSASEAAGLANLVVELTAVSGRSVKVNYAVTGGTATGGGTDFTLASGTLTFSAGQTTKNVSITISDDAVVELDETIQVTLSSPSSATLGTNTTHTFTILDDDSGPPALNPAAGLDDGQTGYSEDTYAGWQAASGGWNGGHRVAAATTYAYVTWSFTLPAGTYEFYASWSADASRHSAVYYLLPGASVTIDQRTAPDDGRYGGTLWESLGTYSLSGGIEAVKLLVKSADALSVAADGIIAVAV